MKVLFVHGLESGPLGHKARYLAARFETSTPEMDTRDFPACVRLIGEAIRSFSPDVVVGSSFGGGVALALLQAGAWSGPTLLLAQAGQKMGLPATLPDGVRVLIVHGTRDALVPPGDSRRLASSGTPGLVELLEVDDEHRLATLIADERLADLVHRAATS